MSYSSDCILEGLDRGHFSDLPIAVKKDMIGLLARVSEKSYRRGVQHGQVFSVDEVGHWRFGNLSRSPDANHPSRVLSVEERLFEQNPEIREIGL